MRGKILFLVGLGVGYVLGTKAGRQRYEQISAQWKNVWESQPVQTQVLRAGDFVREKAPEVAGQVEKQFRKVNDQVKSRRSQNPGEAV
jgi:histidinol-phosphate/aromatic aminotransferase/cobyric acid decarboxylase-like protein